MRTSTARMLPVAIPGSRGAYTQEAALRYFGKTGTFLPCGNASDAVRAIGDGRASHAVLPVENSVTGAFDGVAEAIFEGDVCVVGEIHLPIRHAVMALPGTRLDELSVLTSHPSSLAQCRDWIARWGLATRQATDTAAAARDLVTEGNAALGVLGSRTLAATHGLDVLAEGLSDHPDNETRFLVLASAEEEREGGWRHAIKVGPVVAPRTLKTLRIQLESLGASRVRVPFLGSEDGRRFLIEFDHRSGDGFAAAERACGTLPHRFLGTWEPDARRAG
jgi:prephenate dehydratase